MAGMPGIMDIDIDSSGFLRLDGRLFRSKEPGADGLAARIGRLAQIMRLVSEHHSNLLGADSRLVGQEKVELARQMDGLLIEVLGLRCHITGTTSFSISIPKTSRTLQITIDGDAIHGSGQLGNDIRLKPDRFAVWLHRMRDERLPAFVRKLGQAFEDGLVTDEERRSLLHDIDLLFLGILVMRESLLRVLPD